MKPVTFHKYQFRSELLSASIGRGGWCLLAIVLLMGCGRRGNFYHPSSIPSDLTISRTESAQQLDLSKLATHAIGLESIDNGDVLEVLITSGYGDEKAEPMQVRVGDDGVASVPIVGRVPLAGIALPAAEQAIFAAAVERGFYRNPSVTVTMKNPRTNQITVIGAVEKPGVYELRRGSSNLLAAIVAADGLSKEAGTNVEIRKPTSQPPDRTAQGSHHLAGYSPIANGVNEPPVQPVSYRVDLVAASKQGNSGQILDDGDVVMVERRNPQPVHVIGLVQKPGQFELPPDQDLHLVDVIAMAGGLNNNAADKIHLIRASQTQQTPAIIEISLKEAKTTGAGNLRLGPGDIVSVEDTPITVLVDSIRMFFRVGFNAGMPGF